MAIAAIGKAFSKRRREAIHAARVVVFGQCWNLSASVGVSNIRVAAVVSGGARQAGAAALEVVGTRIGLGPAAGGDWKELA